MNTGGGIESELIAIANRLRALIPEGHSTEIDVRDYHSQRVLVNIHGVKTYSEGKAVCTRLGIQRWQKRVFEDVRTVLIAELGGVEFNIYCEGLPPTCRMETVIERIPKTQTVESGEFIEVERQKIICGEPDSDRKAIVESLHDIPALAGMVKEGDQ